MRWLHSAWRLSCAILLSSVFCSFTKYELSCDSKLLSKSKELALSQVGVQESGENRGEVAKYLKSVGLREGYSYCAAGVYWCFQQGAEQLGLGKSVIPVKRTAVANAMFNDAKRKGQKVLRNVEENDLLVWKSKSSWHGHIERVIQVKGKGIVKTVGFNVKLQYGEGVGIKTRFLNHRLGRMLLRGIITFKEVR